MFAGRYFAPRYFAPRYWPKIGAPPNATGAAPRYSEEPIINDRVTAGGLVLMLRSHSPDVTESSLVRVGGALIGVEINNPAHRFGSTVEVGGQSLSVRPSLVPLSMRFRLQPQQLSIKQTPPAGIQDRKAGIEKRQQQEASELALLGIL